MVREHKILGWPAIRAELEASAPNLWHGLAWTGSLRAANALIGRETGDDDYYDPEKEPPIDIEPLEITEVTKRMYCEAFLPDGTPSPAPRRDSMERELEHMQVMTWLEMQPETSLVEIPPRTEALKRLLRAAQARNTLYDLAEMMTGLEPDSADGGLPEGNHRLTVAGIAALAHMDERSVRNAVGPAKRLVSIPRKPAKRERRSSNDYSVEVDAYQALNWLAGRRYYRAARLDPRAYVKCILGARPDQVGRILGLLVWSNIGTTQQAREELNRSLSRAKAWTASELDGWFEHGPTAEGEKQAQLANLIGLDPAVLTAARTRRG